VIDNFNQAGLLQQSPGLQKQIVMKLQTKIELIKAGISQREIAKEAGVSNTSVSCYLTGSVDLSERMQGRIEAAITKLLNRENQPVKQR
jgi:predicted transcriptional regulator